MRKKMFVTVLTAAMICGALTACGNTTDTTTEDTSIVTEETTTEAEVVETPDDATTEATETEATDTEADTEDSAMDADGNVTTTLTDNDVNVDIEAKAFPGTWYIDDSYATASGKLTMYNVPTKEDAYSNSPRISVELMDQDSVDYYADSKENVTDIDSITINSVEYSGTTYTQYGMEWTEYKAAVEGTDEFIIIRISDVDVTTGEGSDVLNSIKFATSSDTAGDTEADTEAE